MYEKDKARYEKEMKQYAKEKLSKEPTKLLKMKKPKSKKTPKVTEHTKSPPDLVDSAQTSTAIDAGSLVTESPTSQFNLLNNLPFANLPSPMVDIGGDNDDDSFHSFGYNTV
jgi:glutamate synthase domain-containing protein 2